jgi:hypothetical protein
VRRRLRERDVLESRRGDRLEEVMHSLAFRMRVPLAACVALSAAFAGATLAQEHYPSRPI